MKLEEALIFLREGKKITNPLIFEDDEYLIGGYASLIGEDIEVKELKKIRRMTICKMKGEFKHPEMTNNNLTLDEFIYIKKKLGKNHDIPCISLHSLMSEEWKVIEDK